MDQRKNYTIKQIMPLPEGYEVMMEVAQQDGTKMMEAAKETLFPYCLVLLEGTMVTELNFITSFPAAVWRNAESPSLSLSVTAKNAAG